MALRWQDIQANAIRFAKQWSDASNEEAQAQSFQREFFAVFGLNVNDIGDYEYKVPLDDGHNGYIDFLWKSHIAIEMKSRGKDLSKAYEQIKEYIVHLPAAEMPDLLMVCDFENIRLYRRSTGEMWSFKTKELSKHIRKFANIAGYETTREFGEQIEVNVRAAEKMAKLHDAMKSNGYEGHDLELYLVRLLFCLFGDDTGIFEKDSFYNYIENSKEDGTDLSARLSALFDVLDMPPETRAKRKLLSNELRNFTYIDGGLFADRVPVAEFDSKMRRSLLDCCNFDWNRISPAIFGAMFQGVMDAKERRELGAHYTSEENILKLINPLFMDELWQEFERVKTDGKRLEDFHDRISGLSFLDPACGCGNFLIITYRELRKLELEILKMREGGGQRVLDIAPLMKVSVDQFYGIEIEDFPCQTARVGMWLMDHQMNTIAAEHFGSYYARLPLTQSATIVNGNALKIDWEEIISKDNLGYIMGNPPFIGAANLSKTQKKEVLGCFEGCKSAGVLDYVASWYKKTAELIQHTNIKAAFVSTNSITQGEQVAVLWKPLFEQLGVHINFAYKTFKWSNEAKGKAAVHCVIVGFSQVATAEKYIYDTAKEIVESITPYLTAGNPVFIERRTKPLCAVPLCSRGNQPTDGGNLIIETEDYDEFIRKEPNASRFIKRLTGSEEFINNKERYCLWLVNASPAEISSMPLVMERIRKVKEMREQSTFAPTRDLANFPTRFREILNPKTYIAIPRVSSEKRSYIPIGFLDDSIIPTDSVIIIPDATLYHFGILTSSTHMAWVRTVCGRLKSDYRYSKDIVYNNFPWPEATEVRMAEIEKAAQAVLDARALYATSSLANLYDPLTMPPELTKAHKHLDRQVQKAYDANWQSEAECVAELMERYKKLTAPCPVIP